MRGQRRSSWGPGPRRWSRPRLAAAVGLAAAALWIKRDGADYHRRATLAPDAAAAMRLAVRTEGIFLDPTHTGRALAGLAALVADGRIKPGARTVSCTPAGCPACSVIPGSRT